MSQERTRRGQRIASSREGTGASGRRPSESASSPRRARERAEAPSERGEQLLDREQRQEQRSEHRQEQRSEQRQEQRPTRESGVHAILNPARDEASRPEPLYQERRRGAATQPGNPEPFQPPPTYAGSGAEGRSRRLSSAPQPFASSSSRSRPHERPHGSGPALPQIQSVLGTEPGRYPPSSIPSTTYSGSFIQRGQEEGDPDPLAPFPSHLRSSDPASSARDTGRRSASGYAAVGGSASRPGGLAADVGQLDLERMGSAPTSQGGYQYMTMDTGQGLVSFQVDVQQASRVADEKRRRNALASARFRARRKENEVNSTREIDDLRQQIEDLEEEVDFYRGERDFLVPYLYNSPDRNRHFPRPMSPRRRRPYAGSGSETGYAYEEHGQRSAQERHTRRRLSTGLYDEPQPLPPSSALPPVQQGAYLPPRPPPPPPPLLLQPLPEHPFREQQPPYAQGGSQPIPPRGPPDPAPRGYDNRPWPPPPPGGRQPP